MGGILQELQGPVFYPLILLTYFDSGLLFNFTFEVLNDCVRSCPET